METTLKICFVIALSLFATTDADIACPAQEPCTCTTGVIDCNDRGLSTVPSFSPVAGHFHTLKLSNNSLTVVPDNAFASLNITTLLLNDNQINHINNNAFNGIAEKILKLNFANNNINQLPLAVSYLNNIRDLDVSGNPIPGYTPGSHGHHGSEGLTDATMRKLGSTLIRFSFGGEKLNSWPKSLSHLNQLQELRVSGLKMVNLVSNCFHGFEHTLHKLTIEHATLVSVPLCIRDLTHLRELHLDHMNDTDNNGNVNFNDGSMVAAPFDNLADTLEILSLNHDGLTFFPENIKDLKHLRNLSLDENDLEFVSDEAINLLKHSNISSLSLRSCNLKRVPGAISDLTILESLNLKGNMIRSIESTDLQNLVTLTKLDLSYNPLQYISDNSLCGLHNLQEMELEKTSLRELSPSFKNLLKLKNLNLIDSQIDCTCDMAWVGLWKRDCQRSANLTIEGECETISETINDYVVKRLPDCLDFTHIQSTCNTICTQGPVVPTRPGK